MSDSINCNFARCAVRHFMHMHMTKGNILPKGVMPQIVREYNHHFSTEKGFQVSYSLASRRFPAICKLFHNKWHPKDMKGAYLTVFSTEAWKALSQEEQDEHTLRECKACQDKFAEFSKAFPVPTRRGKKQSLSPKQTNLTAYSYHSMTFQPQVPWEGKC